MTRLTPKEFAQHLETGERPFLGLDIAVNMKKGLRFVARLSRGVCELTLRFRRDVRLSRIWPFLDLPIPSGGNSCRLDFQGIFELEEEDASVVADCFQRAKMFAVDAPCSFAHDNERRLSELAWHRMEIPLPESESFLKQKNRGVLWSPRKSEVEAAIDSYFSPDDASKPTTQQLLLISQSLWMFVGLWVYQVLDELNTPRIEVYPHASRIICQEIATLQEDRELLREQVNEWSRAFSFEDFITHKSETNDAAIASFTGFLQDSGLTEELATDEIVIPRRPVAGRLWSTEEAFATQAGQPPGAMT